MLKDSISRNKFKIESVSEKSGAYGFYISDGSCLYRDYTANLRRSLSLFIESDSDSTEDLRNQWRFVAWEITGNLLDALRLVLLHPVGSLNERIAPYREYVYLGINFSTAPYYSICDHTAGDLYYLGPFRSRFQISDFLDTLSIFTDLPPFSVETEDEQKRSLHFDNFSSAEKLTLFMRNLFSINQNLLKDIEQQRNKLLESLNFTDEELLSQQYHIIRRYYDYLRFLHVTKKLKVAFPYNNYGFIIENGMIKTLTHSAKAIYEASGFLEEYQPGEFLAVSKNELNERRTIFQQLKSLPENDTLYEASVQQLRKQLCPK